VQRGPGPGGAGGADIPVEIRETGVGLVELQKKTERLDLGKYRDGLCFACWWLEGEGGNEKPTGLGGKVGNEGRGGCKGRHDNTQRDAVRVKFGAARPLMSGTDWADAANHSNPDRQTDTRDET
jgi:hypothetical protein